MKSRPITPPLTLGLPLSQPQRSWPITAEVDGSSPPRPTTSDPRRTGGGSRPRVGHIASQPDHREVTSAALRSNRSGCLRADGHSGGGDPKWRRRSRAQPRVRTAIAIPTAAIPMPTAPMTSPNPPIRFMVSATSLIHRDGCRPRTHSQATTPHRVPEVKRSLRLIGIATSISPTADAWLIPAAVASLTWAAGVSAQSQSQGVDP